MVELDRLLERKKYAQSFAVVQSTIRHNDLPRLQQAR
jgi:hypothetical protein